MKALKIIALFVTVAAVAAGVFLALCKFTDMLHRPLASVRTGIKKHAAHINYDEEFELPMPSGE